MTDGIKCLRYYVVIAYMVIIVFVVAKIDTLGIPGRSIIGHFFTSPPVESFLLCVNSKI